jgi:hypothetical protein
MLINMGGMWRWVEELIIWMSIIIRKISN